ncbi:MULTISPECIES: type II secretion system F family protein [unclassified Microbacterium]|uniref:type II secretion system F family protein n=1 Tax=unclassified Microbacterium TaxID=2609290 RepID=UPI0019A2BA78|nr:type II secretion system F family protein [Microbacterium sp.]MBD3758082.1 type II secretion system F family protein [Microbacterium sp.]
MSRREKATDAGTAAAATVQRLAVLLEAGIAPERAWQLLAEAGDIVGSRVVAAPRGTPVGTVLEAEGGAWRDVAVAWRVSETVGAPLAASLRRFAEALRDAQESRDDVAVALADPAATARLVAWLPLAAVVLGVALGFDVAVVLAQPAGIACLVAGGMLMLVARRWTSRLVARAQPDDRLAGVQGDVVAIALTGGVSVERALAVVEGAGGGAPDDDTAGVLALSARAGAPAVDLLRAAAADARRRARTDGRLRAARLGARLLLPMGVCTLPAFLLLGVGPMLLSVLAGSNIVLTAPTVVPAIHPLY